MQLSFFPEPLPDEPLYSLIARYHSSLLYRNPGDTYQDLFGSRVLTVAMDLPSNVSSLHERLPWNIWTREELIAKHTSAPYYAFVLSDEKRTLLIDAILRSDPPNPSAELGLMSANIKRPANYRACEKCIEEDRLEFGTAYWHRTHQLPGVIVCPRHGIPLKITNLERKRRERYRLATLEEIVEVERLCPVSCPYDTEIRLSIARDSEFLLSHQTSCEDFENLRLELQTRFRIFDWLGAGSTLRASTVRKAWSEQYPEDFLVSLECGAERMLDPISLIRSLLFGGRRKVHPLGVILVTRLVGWSIRNLINVARNRSNLIDYEFNAFCINEVCPEFGTARWIELDSVGNRENRISVCCNRCGMKYTQNKTGDEKRKIHERGFLWDKELTRFIELGTHSLREVSRALDVDPMTVKRHAARLGLTTPWKIPEERISDLPPACEKRDTKRDIWRSLRKANPLLSRAKLRSSNKALWTWLYRYDRQWLEENSPTPLDRKNVRKINWEERDKQLVLDLKQCVDEMISSDGRPIRITKTDLARQLGITTLFKDDAREHLPGVVEVIQGLSESREHYAKRKIAWCARKYIEECDLPKRWELIRRAGLRSDLVDSCKSELSEALEEIERSLVLGKVK